MADNIIKVNVTANKSQRVTVSSANVGTEITASSDTGRFWAQTAKNWAVSENIVDNEDYSSKYYANKSKGYAQTAESFAAAARETYNNIVTKSDNAITEIEELKEISEQEISIAVADGLTEINSTKTTILNDIEFVADGEKKEIEELAEETQNKIIDLGIDTRANVDLSNLSSVGEKHFLNKQQITNCLLEVPQKINLELDNGVLTLKAGSQAITVAGSIQITNDISYTAPLSFPTSDFLIVVRIDGTTLLQCQQAEVTSDDTNSNTPNRLWFNTSDNKCYVNDGNGVVYTETSLPIALIKCVNGVGFTEIKQVFNGMGYIGSTIWVDKGVKGLIPNGRNEDGSLRNTEITTQNIRTKSVTSGNGTFRIALVEGGGIFLPAENSFINGTREFDIEENYFKQDSEILKWCEIGSFSANVISPYDITSFNPKQPFRAMDYSDYVNTPHIVETYQNGTSWYRVWSDGWKEQGGALHKLVAGGDGATTVTYLKQFSNNDYTLVTNIGYGASTNQSAWQQPHTKTQTGFTYQKDGRYMGNWYACGY